MAIPGDEEVLEMCTVWRMNIAARILVCAALLLSFGHGVFAQPTTIGADAIGRDGARLGVVDNLLLSADGQVQSALIRAKIFMGLVECRMAVPWANIKDAGDSRKVIVDLTKEQFNALPEWEPKKTPELRLAKPE